MPLLHRTLPCLALHGVLLFTALPSHAVLGGTEASVRLDEQRLGASFSVAMAAQYRLYALINPDGVRVREFVSANGLVFGVAWDGPVLPDLELLLGTHFPLYQQGQRQKSRGVRIQQAGLVIESGGMMRSFVGRAFLPGQLPALVVPQDIQ